jgi:arylsulfatase A-like enzyme
MSSRPRIAAVFAFVAASFASSCTHEETPHRPNIVLVSIDSLRRDHVGSYGYAKATTPVIDALAKDGVRFDSAVSTTSWTLPAHAAMFTGLYDSTHGLYDNGLRLAPEHATLAEELDKLGYHTAGFFSGPYLHPTFGLGDGFEIYRSCMTVVDANAGDEAVRSESRAPAGKSHDDITGPRTVEEVTRWADERPKDQPFFLFVHMWDVHYDYIPPAPYDTKFDPDYTGPLTGVNFMGNPDVNPQMAPRELEHLLALYDGEIAFTDDNLGKLLAALRSRGMLEDTLVVVTADHGEEFFEHFGKGHQKTLFDEVVRVPLVVSWPGRLAPAVVSDQVRTIDIAPLLLTAAGATKLPPMQGRDILPLARGEKLPLQAALCELHADKQDRRALRTNEWKLYAPGRTPMGALPPMGFDLAADPKERVPLEVGRDARFQAAARELQTESKSAAALRDWLGARSRQVTIDPELEAKLRQMGYLGDTPGANKKE